MVKTANEIFRDFVTDGVPASGVHQPIKADIREFLEFLNSEIFGVSDVASATAISFPAAIKRLKTNFFNASYISSGGGAQYRRISFADLTGYPTQSYFRTTDRYMPDGSTSDTNGGYWVLDEDKPDWSMFGVRADGTTDDTVAGQAAINFVALSSLNRVLRIGGNVSATKFTIPATGSGFIIEADNCFISANSTSAQTTLFEVKSGNTHIRGRLILNCAYKTNYDTAFWYWTETQAQFSRFDSVVANSAKIGFRIGNIAYPSAILSENVLINPQTYGCPVAMEVVGGENYVSVSEAQLSADAFGGDASWAALSKVVVRNKGATFMANGGEYLITGDTSGVAFRQEPIDRGSSRVEWGTIAVNNATIETASPLCIIDNLGLTINNSASGRRGMVNFTNCSGYHSQDLATFIYVPAAYNDYVVIQNPNFWKTGATRTQPNVFCAGGSTAVISQEGDFGPGFIAGLTGIQGGRVNFSRREVFRGNKANGQTFTAANGFETVIYQAADAGGDKSRWLTSYSNSTGIFTVPDGGFEDVIVTVSVRMTDAVTGDIRLCLNGTASGNEILRTRLVNGSGNLVHSCGNLVSGDTLRIQVDVDTNTTGIAADALNVFSITARRGVR